MTGRKAHALRYGLPIQQIRLGSPMAHTIAVFGTSGAIGKAIAERIAADQPDTTVHAFSRTLNSGEPPNLIHHTIDYLDETALASAAELAPKEAPWGRVIVATGILHQGEIQPEKALRSVNAENLRALFDINTVIPSLIAKHFVPKLNRNAKAEFAVLSARAGSIADNEMGGWYAYRASKAALNMMVKNTAIETARRNKHAVIAALHPGVVDSALSKPFQKFTPPGKLFSPEDAAARLITLLDQLTPEQSGGLFEWDGEEVAP